VSPTRLLLHACSYTPALTRLLLHACSYYIDADPTISEFEDILNDRRLPNESSVTSTPQRGLFKRFMGVLLCIYNRWTTPTSCTLNWLSPEGCDDPKRYTQIKIMPDACRLFRLLSSKRKCKPKVFHAVCVHMLLFLVACLLSR
jgi:hypothetical protein